VFQVLPELRTMSLKDFVPVALVTVKVPVTLVVPTAVNANAPAEKTPALTVSVPSTVTAPAVDAVPIPLLVKL